jgi:hypothetical protein
VARGSDGVGTNGLPNLLREREDAILERWLQDTLAVYPEGGARAFGRERDRFANPVGHSIREGTRAIFEALLDDGADDTIRPALDTILSIRAVQQLPPHDAVGFLFRLKDLIRTELADRTDEPPVAGALLALERRIDRAALTAFETYVGYRELVYELRINEVKRNVPWAARRARRE